MLEKKTLKKLLNVYNFSERLNSPKIGISSEFATEKIDINFQNA